MWMPETKKWFSVVVHKINEHNLVRSMRGDFRINYVCHHSSLLMYYFLGTTSSALQRPQQTFLSFWMKSCCKVSRQEAQAISVPEPCYLIQEHWSSLLLFVVFCNRKWGGRAWYHSYHMRSITSCSGEQTKVSSSRKVTKQLYKQLVDTQLVASVLRITLLLVLSTPNILDSYQAICHLQREC